MTTQRSYTVFFFFADAMEKIEEESQMLDRQLLDKEIDLAVFVQRYMRLRTTYHRQALLQLAAQAIC